MKLYLEQLIYSLSDLDIQRLNDMDLKRSKMRSYIEILIQNRSSGIPSNEFIMKRLDLDKNSFMKMRSVILSRCLNELVPEGGTKLLDFLSRYRLTELFMREADELIKKSEEDSSVTREEKAHIYLQSVRCYFRLPYGIFDATKLKFYIKGFLANYSTPDKLILQDLIRLNEIFILIVQSFYTLETSEENYIRFSKEIKGIQDKFEKLKIKRLKYFAEGVHLILDFYYTGKWEELQQKFENQIKFYTELNEPDAHDELFALKFYAAYNQIMLNNFSKANEMFAQLRKDYEEVFHYFTNVVFRYALSLLMEGRNKECKTLIDTYLKKDKLVFDPDGTIMSCIVYTVYHLLENEVEEAEKYINLYNSIQNVKNLFSFRIGMRVFEIVYFFQRGDEKFAADQLKKVARYLKDKSPIQGTRNFFVLTKALSDLFNKLVASEIDLHVFEDKITQLFKGNQIIMGKLMINASRLRALD